MEPAREQTWQERQARKDNGYGANVYQTAFAEVLHHGAGVGVQHLETSESKIFFNEKAKVKSN